jgi:hypothetical protein
MMLTIKSTNGLGFWAWSVCDTVFFHGSVSGEYTQTPVSSEVLRLQSAASVLAGTLVGTFVGTKGPSVCRRFARITGVKKPPDMAASVPLLTNQLARVVRKNLLVRKRCTHS